jgi:hypothetical protein
LKTNVNIIFVWTSRMWKNANIFAEIFGRNIYIYLCVGGWGGGGQCLYFYFQHTNKTVYIGKYICNRYTTALLYNCQEILNS